MLIGKCTKRLLRFARKDKTQFEQQDFVSHITASLSRHCEERSDAAISLESLPKFVPLLRALMRLRFSCSIPVLRGPHSTPYTPVKNRTS